MFSLIMFSLDTQNLFFIYLGKKVVFIHISSFELILLDEPTW